MASDPEFHALLRPAGGRPVRVLELGSGLGVCGLLAARLCRARSSSDAEAFLQEEAADGKGGAGRASGVPLTDGWHDAVTQTGVTLTDLVPAVLDNLAAAVAANGLGGTARVAALDWARDAGVPGGESSAAMWYAGDVAPHDAARCAAPGAAGAAWDRGLAGRTRWEERVAVRYMGRLTCVGRAGQARGAGGGGGLRRRARLRWHAHTPTHAHTAHAQ